MAKEPKQKYEEPIINLRGEKIALGPMRRDLVPLYYRWANDMALQHLLGYSLGARDLEQQYKRFDEPDDRGRWFTMYEMDTWKPIGMAGLKDVDLNHRTAEFGITISEPSARGKGYGTEAALLILDFGFTGLGLHSVMLMTGATNIAGQRSYAKAGFKEFGRRRQADRNGEAWYDLVYMDILAEEFESPYLAKMIAPPTPR